MKLFKYILPLMLVLVGFAFTSSKVEAIQIKAASVQLGDSRANVNSTYLFSFTHTSANTIKSMTFDFCKVASDVGSSCPSPVTTGSVAAAAVSAVSGNLGVFGDWTPSVTGKVVTITNATNGPVLGADAAVTVTLSGIENTTLAEACDGTAGTDTCFIWIKTYDPGPSLVDTGVVTYTVVDAVTVTAKVDPTFTFVVAGVNAGTVNNQITTSVASTASTLPFGSLQAGTPKYMAHALYVTTNTGAGYSITAKMATQMTGVNNSNNIDPFVAPWLTSTTWTEPTGGTPNVDTGWFGGNTTDTDITGWDASPALKFGGIGSAAFVEVSKKLSSDNGTVPVYVTYAIEANVFQPSDFYTGTLIYNALPTY